MAEILVLHGPNLNLLGRREPEIYGADTLADINQQLLEQANSAGFSLEAFQSNSEEKLIIRIHACFDDDTAMIIINPAAFTHTSVALRDALAGVGLPFIECHLSNVHKREEFRHFSYLSDLAEGVICGFGKNSYFMALTNVIDRLQSKK